MSSSTAASVNAKMDQYKLLGVSPGATLTEVREAYFKKVKLYHPDINPTEEARVQFAQIQEAYKELSGNLDRRLGSDRSMKPPSRINDQEAESKEEQEARLAKKREDQKIFRKVSQDLGNVKTWTYQDELGTFPKIIRKGDRTVTNEEEDRFNDEMKNSKFNVAYKGLLAKLKRYQIGPEYEEWKPAFYSANKWGALILVMFLIHNLIQADNNGILEIFIPKIFK